MLSKAGTLLMVEVVLQSIVFEWALVVKKEMIDHPGRRGFKAVRSFWGNLFWKFPGKEYGNLSNFLLLPFPRLTSFLSILLSILAILNGRPLWVYIRVSWRP